MAQQPKRKVDLGPAIPWSDDDLDRLSQISPEDLEAGKALWRETAPPKLATLLDAEPVEDVSG